MTIFRGIIKKQKKFEASCLWFGYFLLVLSKLSHDIRAQTEKDTYY